MDKIKEIVSNMTLEEKAGLCVGLDQWNTKSIDRLGISSIMVADGPHGLRKQDVDWDTQGFSANIPATCFPTSATTACSWDRELLHTIGSTIGKEASAENISIVLGPGVNIKRSPLCGRNFEYFSEDPYLSGTLASEYIKGVQENNVGCCVKHFAANNQEFRRMTVNAEVEERTLREIYLRSFEMCVKDAKPWTVMSAYNRLNGEYCSNNKILLTDILRDEWGFEGFVMSDWGATVDIVESLKAGMELEMPGTHGISEKKIIDAVNNGEMDINILDTAVERILNIIINKCHNKSDNTYNNENSHEIAIDAAKKSLVLLKNEEKLLPLKKIGRVLVVGELAEKPRIQGFGSSVVLPTRVDKILDEMKRASEGNVDIEYQKGYCLSNDCIDEDATKSAVASAVNADSVIVFAGLPENKDTECIDRSDLLLPLNQINLLNELSKVNKNIVVVLMNGSAIEMSWIDNVKAILEAYLPGQGEAAAIADILFGNCNPSGKLAESFPEKLSHNPSYLNFPGEGDLVKYNEGIFVGYRYYDTKEIKTLFPFGHGLSYTTFAYSDITVDKEAIKDTEKLIVTVHIKNTGDMSGSEIVQLYVRDVESDVIRPFKELKGFDKVYLEPGEEKAVSFILDKMSFAYYNTEIKDYYVESGEFEILIGASSTDIRLMKTVSVTNTNPVKKVFTKDSIVRDIIKTEAGKMFYEQAKETFLFGEDGYFKGQREISEAAMTMILDSPLRSLLAISKGAVTDQMLDFMLMMLND